MLKRNKGYLLVEFIISSLFISIISIFLINSIKFSVKINQNIEYMNNIERLDSIIEIMSKNRITLLKNGIKTKDTKIYFSRGYIYLSSIDTVNNRKILKIKKFEVIKLENICIMKFILDNDKSIIKMVNLRYET